MKKELAVICLLIGIIVIFFSPFFLQGKLPIPADTIVGLYHPFRDLYARDYPNGIPYKNFLITDPVRQQYPWRFLAIDSLQHKHLPLWNPYTFSGAPLLANIQSAVFYPLNILLLVFPFTAGWSIQVFLQPVLFAIFLYMYLRNLHLAMAASFLAAIAVAFSGFSVAWMEWNTVLQTGLWLPLLLLAIDKILIDQVIERSFFTDNKLWWGIVFILALSASFFAGHLQIFFYVFLFSLVYSVMRFIHWNPGWKVFLGLISCYFFFGVVTIAQWYPSYQLIAQSARDIDLDWHALGWFLPWQHLLQFLIPDFFGNPTTLNYWGVWNYAELNGFVGVIPFLFALYAVMFRRDKKTYFFAAGCFFSMIMLLPILPAQLPFLFNIPFLSTAQPTRLLYVVDVCLAILAALGFDYFLKQRKHIIYPVIILLLFYVGIWGSLRFGNAIFHISQADNAVAMRNVYFPIGIFIAGSFMLLVLQKVQKQQLQVIIICFLILLSAFDLFRFFTKFTPFTEKDYLFPQTKSLSFLQHQKGLFRIMETDSRVFPPNFSTIYKLQSIDGYDPLYIRRYGELIAASERGKPDIRPPFGFNRIITPKNYASKIVDLLGVKYVLSLDDITSPKLKKVFQEGQTRVYENNAALPRVFFVKKTFQAKTKQEAINRMMDSNFDPHEEAVVESQNGSLNFNKGWAVGEVKVKSYTENLVTIETNITTGDERDEGFLVFTDSYFPTWSAKFSKKEDMIFEAESAIQLTDYNFRGVVVPYGKYVITFHNSMFPKLSL